MKRISILPIIIFLLLTTVGLVLAIVSGSMPRVNTNVRTLNDSLVWPDSTWKRSSYAERGVDSLPILELIDSLRNQRFGSIYSLLVVKDGCLITEEYFWGDDSLTLRSAYSATKSVLSAIVGIAVEHGELPAITTPIHTLLPRYKHIFKDDSLKRLITLEHLLTMTAGFQWDEWSSEISTENDHYGLLTSATPIEFALARPVVNVPGQVFNYNSGCSIIISAILENATGMSVKEYAEHRLFGPLGISEVRWPDLDEVTEGASGLATTPVNLARFGLLYARQGQWRERQLVPYDWYERSTSSYKQVVELDTIMPSPMSYGYHWWTMRSDIPEFQKYFPQGLLFAIGSGNQLIFISPDYDLVVVMTANQSPDEIEEHTPMGCVFYYVLRAVIPELYQDKILGQEQETGENSGE